MGWQIKCIDKNCDCGNWASNIANLIEDCVDDNGWFISACGRRGFIEKDYNLQEQGETWKPFLLGAIRLFVRDENTTYFPFVFLVGNDPRENSNGPVTDIWFSYYKDLRGKNGGRLKLGYGPGGPPVLEKSMLIKTIRHLVKIQYLTRQDIFDK